MAFPEWRKEVIKKYETARLNGCQHVGEVYKHQEWIVCVDCRMITVIPNWNEVIGEI